MSGQERDELYARYVAAGEKQVELFNARESVMWRWHDSFSPYIVGIVILAVLDGPQWFWGLGVIAFVYWTQTSLVRGEFRKANKLYNENGEPPSTSTCNMLR